MRKWKIAVVGTLAVVVLAACGTEDDGGAVSAEPSETSSGSASEGAASHNDADVEFAQKMVPHHEGAIEMAQIALDKDTSPEVKDLAERIEAAQGPELEMLQGWLEEWGEEADSGMAEHGGMSSSDSSADIDELENLEGADFEEAFLTMMKEHHEGAIDMAETELEEGEYPPALELAQAIIDAQTAEIEEIDALLAEL